MRGYSAELKVGAFAIGVLAVLTFMTFKVGGLEWAKKKGISINIVFSSTAGLDEKTRVKVAGVDAGVVESIDLSDGKAKVRIQVDPKVKLYKNAKASIRSTGLLGDKYLDIAIGTSDRPEMRDGDTITDVVELVDMDDLARNIINVSQNFNKLAESLNEVLGTEQAKKSLSETIVNLREVSANLNQTITVNDQKLRSVLDNINLLTSSISGLIDKNREPFTDTVSNMKEFTSSLRKDGSNLVENLNRATRELRAMVEENRPAIKSAVESMDSIAKQVDRGEGTLGKLVKDDRLYESINKAAEGMNKTFSAIDRFRTFITFQTEYLTKEKDGKAYFDVTLQPAADKYYILGVVGGPPRTASSKETTTGSTTVTETELKEKIRFNAQFAKRFGNSALRIGLFESSFGIGADYFFNNDKGKLTADVWDFQKDEESSKTAHVKIGVNYFLFKNLFVSAGGDNILSKKYRGGYVGMGVRFEDDDFKYLLGTIPRISTQ